MNYTNCQCGLHKSKVNKHLAFGSLGPPKNCIIYFCLLLFWLIRDKFQKTGSRRDYWYLYTTKNKYCCGVYLKSVVVSLLDYVKLQENTLKKETLNIQEEPSTLNSVDYTPLVLEVELF